MNIFHISGNFKLGVAPPGFWIAGESQTRFYGNLPRRKCCYGILFRSTVETFAKMFPRYTSLVYRGNIPDVETFFVATVGRLECFHGNPERCTVETFLTWKHFKCFHGRPAALPWKPFARRVTVETFGGMFLR